MKKVILFLFLFSSIITTSVAQNFHEVVYLKNGSIIRGIIIEQIPDSTLKIQTADGSIFAYKMSDVEKITKESKNKSKNNLSLSFDNQKTNTWYKGFIDIGYTIGTGDWGEDRLELSTSHGYKFNPYLYTGVGVGASYYHDSDAFALPIFAHIRATILDNRTSPYIDFRIGYALIDAEGFYMSPSVGCKIDSFNIGIGYVMQKVETYWGSENCGGFSFKIGYEF